MSDIRIKMAKDLRDMSDMVGDLHWMAAKAIEDLTKKEGEIAKRDARIVELESRYQRDVFGLNNEGDPIGGDPAGGYANDNARLRAELAALKAQEPVLPCELDLESSFSCAEKEASLHAGVRDTFYFALIECLQKNKLYRAPAQKELSVVMPERKKAHNCEGIEFWKANGWNDCLDELASIYAAPVSEAKAQGEYGEAYQGAREDLAIWKRRALEAEEKVLQQEQIIDHLTSEAQGESRFGEPVVTPDAPCVPDGYVLADKKALGTVLQALVNAPHHIRELQVTRQPVSLFSDNPINVLIANYEAPAAPVQQPKCRTCDDNGLIGGPSFYSPDEGGEPCPDCSAPVQQVSVPDEMRSLAQRLREYNQNPHHINPMSEAFHILVADAANAISTACVPKEIAAAITWSEHLLFECGALTSTRAPSVHVYNKTFAAVNEARAMLNSAPAAPAADAGMVDALGYQVLFDAIAAATSVYANGAVNISVQAFRDALAAHSAKGVV